MLHYELSHDSIARQVFEKASTEARKRRKVERFVQERYAAYRERGEQILAYGNQLHQPVTGINTSTQGDKVIFQTALGDFMLAGNGDSLMYGPYWCKHPCPPVGKKRWPIGLKVRFGNG